MTKKPEATNIIQNCTFIGVKYDPATIDLLHRVVTVTGEGFQTLTKIADVIKSSNVNIESMVKLEGPSDD